MDRLGTSDAPSIDNSPPNWSPSSEDVASYLARHPDFFTEHQELLSILTPPSARSGNNVVDMQQFMLHRLRQDLSNVKAQHKSLIATSRTNLISQTRVHAAVLALISARNFEHLIHIVTSELTMMLDVDVVTLCVESDDGLSGKPATNGIQILRPGSVEALLGSEKNVLLAERLNGDPIIFGSGAGLVRSQALLRLTIGGNAPAGLIAIGSRKPTRFRNVQGTELLNFLAQSIQITISQWLMLDG